MQLEIKKHIEDIRKAAELIQVFATGKSLTDYRADALLKSGIERQFEIIGEAMGRLNREAPKIAAGISEYKRIIAFRNLLIHCYDVVEDVVVWDVVCIGIPKLLQEAEQLLARP